MLKTSEVVQGIMQAANDNVPVNPYKPPQTGKVAYIRMPTPANDNGKYVGWNRVGRGLIRGVDRVNMVRQAYGVGRALGALVASRGASRWAPNPNATAEASLMCSGMAGVTAGLTPQACGVYYFNPALQPGGGGAYSYPNRSISWWKRRADLPNVGGNLAWELNGWVRYTLVPNSPSNRPIQLPGSNARPQQWPYSDVDAWSRVVPRPGSQTALGQAPQPVPFRAIPGRPGAHPSTGREIGGSSYHATPQVRYGPRENSVVITSNKPNDLTRPNAGTGGKRRPGRGEKEKKARWRNGGLARLGRMLLDNATEGMDLFEAMWDAMDDRAVGRWMENFKARHGRLPRYHERMAFVYGNVQHMDVSEFIQNYAKNQLEDAVIGALHGGANRSQVIQWLRANGFSGITSGPTI